MEWIFHYFQTLLIFFSESISFWACYSYKKKRLSLLNALACTPEIKETPRVFIYRSFTVPVTLYRCAVPLPPLYFLLIVPKVDIVFHALYDTNTHSLFAYLKCYSFHFSYVNKLLRKYCTRTLSMEYSVWIWLSSWITLTFECSLFWVFLHDFHLADNAHLDDEENC